MLIIFFKPLVAGGPSPPNAPANLTATAGNAQVVLSWDASAGADSYSVYRGTSSGGEVLIQSGILVTTFTDTGLSNGTTYFYFVTATNGAGESGHSTEVVAVPQGIHRGGGRKKKGRVIVVRGPKIEEPEPEPQPQPKRAAVVEVLQAAELQLFVKLHLARMISAKTQRSSDAYRPINRICGKASALGLVLSGVDNPGDHLAAIVEDDERIISLLAEALSAN